MPKVYSKQTLEFDAPDGSKRTVRCFEIVQVDEKFTGCKTYRAALGCGVLTELGARKAEKAAEAEPEKPYERMAKLELEKVAEEKGIDLNGCKTKGDILERITGKKMALEQDCE